MNSSAAEKLCSFSRMPWYPVDIWSIVSSLSQRLQHLSKGSILLTLFPMNSLPSLSCSRLLTPACSACPQHLHCGGTAENEEVVSACNWCLHCSWAAMPCSCSPAHVERRAPWRSGKSDLGVSPPSITNIDTVDFPAPALQQSPQDDGRDEGKVLYCSHESRSHVSHP